MMKLVKIDEENVHTFQTTSEISMKFSGKICLMMILKITKNPRVLPLSRKYNWPPSLFRVKLKVLNSFCWHWIKACIFSKPFSVSPLFYFAIKMFDACIHFGIRIAWHK